MDTQYQADTDSIDLRKLPPLKALKGFEAAARLSSVRGAAEELNLTHPAISHQIQSLEESLSVKLFARKGRHIYLTEAGKQYYPFVRQALDTLITGTDLVRNNNNLLPLRIQTYITASIRWLAPRLPKFKKQFPSISIQTSTYGAHWQFDEKHADVALIYNTQELPEYLCWRPIFESYVIPVCSPDCLAQLPSQPSAHDLATSPLISVSTEGKYWGWDDWFESAGAQPLSKEANSKVLEVDTLAAALEMALVGEGIALVNGPFADQDLASGRLVVPVQHKTRGDGEWGIVHHKDMTHDPRVSAFVGWLLDQSKAT